MGGSASLTVLSSLIGYNMGVNTGYCYREVNGTGVTLGSSQSNVTYTLYLNGAVNATATGNGSLLPGPTNLPELIP